MKTIKSPTIGRLHELAVKAVVKHGEEVYTEDNDLTLELPEPLCLECSKIDANYRISDNSSLKEEFMEQYMKYLIEGYNENINFEYDYHSRLFNYNGIINQIDDVIIPKLIQYPTSRRACAITWIPTIDSKSHDCPCLQWMNFTIRNNKLNLTVLFRSNDMLLAAGANMYVLTGLQSYVAEKLNNIEMGKYTHISCNPHIYINRDADELKKFL